MNIFHSKKFYSLLKRNASHIFDSAIPLLGIYLRRKHTHIHTNTYPYVIISTHIRTHTHTHLYVIKGLAEIEEGVSGRQGRVERDLIFTISFSTFGFLSS